MLGERKVKRFKDMQPNYKESGVVLIDPDTGNRVIIELDRVIYFDKDEFMSIMRYPNIENDQISC